MLELDWPSQVWWLDFKVLVNTQQAAEGEKVSIVSPSIKLHELSYQSAKQDVPT